MELYNELQAAKRENVDLQTQLSTFSGGRGVATALVSDDGDSEPPQPTERGVASPEEQGFDEEEKQSSPTSASKKRSGVDRMRGHDKRHSDALLSGFLNVNDLPISSSDVLQHQIETGAESKRALLSELFVGGGRRYWQNVDDSAKGMDTVHGAIYALSS